MEYLFSYNNQFFVKCQKLVNGTKTIALLTQLDKNLHPTGESSEIGRALAEIFLKRCEGFIRNEYYSYGDFPYSQERINTTRKEVNKAFRQLGFPADCYAGSELCEKVTCVPLNQAAIYIDKAYNETEQLFNQEIVFEKPSKSLSIMSSEAFQEIFAVRNDILTYYLYGEGGLGKTNYLKLLKSYGESKSRTVYYCSLSALLDDALNYPIQNSLHCGKDILRAKASSNGYTAHLLRYCSITALDANRNCVFLLDGLNEMFDRNASNTYESIRQILTEITMLHISGIKTVITSRSNRDVDFLPFTDRIRTATLTGVLEEDDDLPNNISDENRRMLSRPLYYQLYRRLIRQRRKWPESVYEIWHLFHVEACKQEVMKKKGSRESMLYIYYILLPLFAYYLESDHKDKLSRIQGIRLIDQLNHSLVAHERSQYIINQNASDSQLLHVHLSGRVLVSFDMLRNIENFLIYDVKSDCISFRHQDIREYFTAFYILWFLKSMKAVPLELCSVPNFNLKTAIREMVLSALGFRLFDTVSDSNAELKEQNLAYNRAQFAQLFPPSKAVLAGTNLEEVHRQIQQNLALAYTAHDFSDRFLLLVDRERYSTMAPFCEGLMQSSRFLYDYPEVLSGIERNVLLQVYATMIQHFRNAQDYEKCREIYDFCMQRIAINQTNRYAVKVKHQWAKTLLSQCQDFYENREYHSDSTKHAANAKQFNDAIELLTQCLPFNLSVNTLAHLYAYPAYWITDHHLIQRNKRMAFSIYKQLYDESNNRLYLYSQNGSDLSYTYRQMAAMLIKGHIRVVNGEIFESNESPLISTEDCYETMEYAEEILAHIDGHDYAHIDWLRGAIQVYKRNRLDAERFFQNESNYLLTKIIQLKLHWTSNETALKKAIDEEIFRLKNNIYQLKQYEKTDAHYLLEDAKMLGYPV